MAPKVELAFNAVDEREHVLEITREFKDAMVEIRIRNTTVKADDKAIENFKNKV